MFILDGNSPVLRHQEGSPARRIPVRVVDDDHKEPDSVPAPPVVGASSGTPESPAQIDWKELALRLQAEMNNFRKRQEQRAEEASEREKERLLRLFLPVVDNLRRALEAEPAGLGGDSPTALREGVHLTYHELKRLLENEGVQEIEALGRPFTPELHEAVATVVDPVRSGLVVEVVEPGYTLNGRLLRPARVVVAA